MFDVLVSKKKPVGAQFSNENNSIENYDKLTTVVPVISVRVIWHTECITSLFWIVSCKCKLANTDAEIYLVARLLDHIIGGGRDLSPFTRANMCSIIRLPLHDTNFVNPVLTQPRATAHITTWIKTTFNKLCDYFLA